MKEKHMTSSKIGVPALALTFLVSILSLLGIGAVGYFLATGGANESFADYPLIVNSHVVLGAVYLLLAPLQFSTKIRTGFLDFHRLSGRLLVAIGFVIGASALFMGLVIPYSGVPEQLIIGFFGSLFLASLIISYTSIRNKDIERHREWMIRALAIGLSIATMRLIFVPGLILLDMCRQDMEAWSITSFTIAFLIHCSVAEFWIWKTKKTPASGQ